jgi:uncharacterized iron-regulated membrane protein
MTLILSIFLLAMIVQGLLLIFKKDMSWREAELVARRQGLMKPERTRQWERRTTVAGIIIIVIAVIMLLITLTQS